MQANQQEKITSREHADFQRDGFLIVRRMYSPEEMREMSGWINRLAAAPPFTGGPMAYYEKSLLENGGEILSRIEKFTEHDANFKAFVHSDKMLGRVSGLLDEPPVLFKEKINFKLPGGGGFEPHQDIQPGWDDYAPYFISVLVTIDPSTIENGCLELAAGHHKKGLLGQKWKSLQGKELEGIEFKPYPMEPGDVAFFDCFVPHQSKPNLTDKPRRNLYLTFNRLGDGDRREKYFSDKEKAFLRIPKESQEKNTYFAYKRGSVNKSTQLRQLLKQKSRLVLAGAHDALSAKLIEEAGFDAVWASSFGVSAATKCMPDANVLTMTEMLEAVKGMNEAISIPVIADCDNGYGNALNVIRMVKEYERAGIAGISIEDNPFPKKCSLYPGERQELVDKDEMAGRIQAAKSTQRNKDFFVIARTEALIAGLGMDEALMRARAYEEAGADAILIHSRQSTPDEILKFASLWDGKVPLVAVPTKYPEITSAALEKIGIKIVIFANQALRASVAAMKETLKEMKQADKPASVNKKIVPLSEVFRLVGQPNLEENEEKFVKSFKKAPAAVIVAAGFEKNIWPLNSDKPKAMLEIKGKTILGRQVDLLRKSGINSVAVVTGYKHEKINLPSIVTYHNPDYRETHMLYSLFLAKDQLKEKFIFLYGDVLFEDFVLEKLLKAKHDINLVVKRSNRAGLASANGSYSKPERDWARTVVPKGADDYNLPQPVLEIGHHLESQDANAEFAGLALFSKRGAAVFRETYEKLLKQKKSGRFHNAANLKKAQFTDLIQELIDRGEKVHAIGIQSGWTDIETFEDYQKAWQTAKA